MSHTLILGGARSGKSGLAERLANETGKPVTYLATATAGDAEMQQRIGHHRARRPAAWHTIEEPLALAQTLRSACAPGSIVLVDCLTLWLTNLIFSSGEQYPDTGAIALPRTFIDERQALLDFLDEPAQGDVIFVSNEVGMGIVPLGAVSRLFTDEAGRLNQDVAVRCDRVIFVAAGLPLVLKGAPC
ncbi:MAG TPA: bifunctional adenosylcobinamide kinase/adenosylcobinamide-phosphate guanylyltransferase [Telluria sp.]|nr:bifunctional adenosylcobinamide kinase/adenosylcobinamide-phosphate guanylyltransferase [Telluria sp.]